MGVAGTPGTLLVTGGAGFIGCNFVRKALAETGHAVVVLDKLTYAGNLASLADVADHPRFTFVNGDIADGEIVRDIFRKARPQAVVNFAAESHVDRSIDDAAPFIRTNVTGAFVLLDAAREWLAGQGPHARDAFRFLHVSTDEVYGSLAPDAPPFSEMTPYAPRSPYAASKAAADHLIRAWGETYGLPVLVTNCSNNYGPYQFPEKLIPLMLLNMFEGQPLPIYGDGGHIRDWLHVEDHCDALLLVLRSGRPGSGYNIGASCERTNLQIIDALCSELARQRPGQSYASLKSFVPDRPGHDRRYAIDASRICSELGWRPRIDLAAGLASTVAWYLSNRAWCETVLAGKYERQRLGLG